MKSIDELLIQPGYDEKLGLVSPIFLRFFEYLRCKVIGKDSFDFLGLRLLDQGVKDDDVLALPKIELKKRRWMMSLPREVRRSTH